MADVGSANEIPLTDSLLPVDDVMAWNRAIKELPTGRCAESLKRAEEFSSQKFAQNMAKAFDSLF